MEYVYGIGNPLIDCLCNIEEKDLINLDLNKGIMLLINSSKQKEILSYLKDKPIKYSPGGSCPNTLITLSALGYNTVVAGGIGKDDLGRKYKERLKEYNVKDELAEKDAVTGTSIILLTEDKERTMNTFLGANRLYSPEDINEETAKNAKLFYFTGYMYDTPSQKNSIKRALEICKANKIKVAFDLADPFAVGRYRSQFVTLIKEFCDIIFANKEEARSLLDNYDAYECCKTMGKLCPTAIVKNGKKGSYISSSRKIYEIPLYGDKKPIDTTGAGDIYAAGFLYGYLKGYSPEVSGKIASYLAGEIVSQMGAQFSSEKIVSLKSFINEYIVNNYE